MLIVRQIGQLYNSIQFFQERDTTRVSMPRVMAGRIMKGRRTAGSDEDDEIAVYGRNAVNGFRMRERGMNTPDTRSAAR
jgi:hypothetical protein